MVIFRRIIALCLFSFITVIGIYASELSDLLDRNAQRSVGKIGESYMFEGVEITDPKDIEKIKALLELQPSKSTRKYVDPLWMGGDVTKVPEGTVFNNWFNVNKTDIKKMEEGLAYWSSKHPYFEWQIRTQISQLTHSPEFARLVKSQYELQKSKPDLERSLKQAQEDARKELRRGEIKKKQQQERNKNLKRWLFGGVTTAAVVAAIIGCIWWLKKPAVAH